MSHKKKSKIVEDEPMSDDDESESGESENNEAYKGNEVCFAQFEYVNKME